MLELKSKYDAWNRLVEVGSNIRYDYNGLNQRVRKTVNNVVTTSFFNSQWQELESSEPQTGVCVYIWGTRYIDDLVLRECGTERLYSLADANWNVVATTNGSGVVQERMKYDAFGKVAWMNAAFTAKSNSAYAWNRTFTGQVLDSETGLMLYRNRYYHTGLGRFVTRDPVGYAAGDASLFRYVGNRTSLYLDPFGLEIIRPDYPDPWPVPPRFPLPYPDLLPPIVDIPTGPFSPSIGDIFDPNDVTVRPIFTPLTKPKPTSPLIFRLPPDRIAKSCGTNEDIVEKLVLCIEKSVNEMGLQFGGGQCQQWVSEFDRRLADCMGGDTYRGQQQHMSVPGVGPSWGLLVPKLLGGPYIPGHAWYEIRLRDGTIIMLDNGLLTGDSHVRITCGKWVSIVQ